LDRKREVSHVQHYNDYFHPTNTLNPAHPFQWTLLDVKESVHAYSVWSDGLWYLLLMQEDSASETGFSYQKWDDLVDGYMCMRENTCLDSICKFCGECCRCLAKNTW
jgi:hypothetical protein